MKWTAISKRLSSGVNLYSSKSLSNLTWTPVMAVKEKWKLPPAQLPPDRQWQPIHPDPCLIRTDVDPRSDLNRRILKSIYNLSIQKSKPSRRSIMDPRLYLFWPLLTIFSRSCFRLTFGWKTACLQHQQCLDFPYYLSTPLSRVG